MNEGVRNRLASLPKIVGWQKRGDTPAQEGAAQRADRLGWRQLGGPLFRKYVALFVAVVCVALISNGAFEVWFLYQEHKTSLIRIQREQADAAAGKIARFIKEIESQIGWTTQLPWSSGSVEQRRFDGLRLLRQVPAITELSQVDASGKEQLRVSRLAMDVVGSQIDVSKEPKFIEAMARKVYYSPVYFRRESEPYMTLALAGTRRDAGVSIAEVNLKLIWDEVSQIKVGKQGQAYVVDAQGRLIAHPDISLVLRNTDLTESGAGEGRARGRSRRRGTGAGSQGRAGPRRAHGLRPGRAARMAGVRRAADLRGLRPALRFNSALRPAAPARPSAGIAGRAVSRPPDGGADSGLAGGRRAHRRRRPWPTHLDQDRRRARVACRSVQRHGRQAAGILCRPRTEGRGTHARAHRVAGAADGDLGGSGYHQQIARRAGARVPGHAGECDAHLRRQVRHHVSARGGWLPHASRCTTPRPHMLEARSRELLRLAIRTRRLARVVSERSRWSTSPTSGRAGLHRRQSGDRRRRRVSPALGPFSSCRCSRRTS